MSNGDGTAKALGTISLIADTPPKLQSPKLQSTEPGYGDNDPVYLALTYCFDLMRRMEYVFKATKAFALSADPELAREIQADNEAINRDGLTWKERSGKAEEIMIRLYTEVGEEHERLLKKSAGRS